MRRRIFADLKSRSASFGHHKRLLQHMQQTVLAKGYLHLQMLSLQNLVKDSDTTSHTRLCMIFEAAWLLTQLAQTVGQPC
jgi:hypothetical protein